MQANERVGIPVGMGSFRVRHGRELEPIQNLLVGLRYS